MRSRFSIASLLSTLFLQHKHARKHEMYAQVNESLLYQNQETRSKIQVNNTSREGQLHQKIPEEL